MPNQLDMKCKRKIQEIKNIIQDLLNENEDFDPKEWFRRLTEMMRCEVRNIFINSNTKLNLNHRTHLMS